MSYTPTEWTCGDTITAEKLNKLENGLADCCGGGTEPLRVRFVEGDNGYVQYDASMTPREFLKKGLFVL